MEFATLNDKKQVNGKIDLLSNILQIDYERVIIEDWIRIDDSSTMGLDYISKLKYGTEDHMDILMKFNRITTNPLAIPVGQVIAVPNLDSFFKWSKTVNIKPIQLQKQKTVIGTAAIETATSIPSRKQVSGQNFTKDANGIFVF